MRLVGGIGIRVPYPGSSPRGFNDRSDHLPAVFTGYSHTPSKEFSRAMIDAAPTPSPFRNARLIRVVMAALVVLLAGSVFGAGTADAKRKRPPRIVALSPFAYNTMAKLNVRPLAVGETLGGDVKKDRRLRNVRVLPLNHPNGPNLEQLARLRPDIVISSTQWRKGTPAMKRLGIRVMYSDPLSVGATGRQVMRIGQITRRKRRARRLVRVMRKQVRAATGRYRKRPRVMLILGVGRTPYTFLNSSWGGQIMKMSGGTLLTGGATARGGFARISDEVVVAQNPEVIVAVPHGSVKDISAMADYVKNNQAWSSTTAVKRGNVYVSIDNSLLQASTDIGRTIRMVRARYLKNR